MSTTTVVGGGDQPAPLDLAYDVWLDRWGQSLGDMPAGAAPDRTVDLSGGFETPRNQGDQYAARIRTLFTPAESGSYRFFVSGDDDARLFVNPNGPDPVGAAMAAYIAGWTTYQQWDRYASQRTAWYELEAGTSYYLEAIGKEGSGDDSVAVGMQRTVGGPVELLPADLIEATSLGEGGWRLATPQGLPEVPGPLHAPGWSTEIGVEAAFVAWNPVAEAEGYHVRLEGGGQVRQFESDVPEASFVGLVPDTRYLLEVAPMNAGGRQASTATVLVTKPGPYPTPVSPDAPSPDARPTVAWDRWDTGWWTLTSIPDGLAPVSTATLAWGLETPPMQGENHAARLRALLTPTETDDYTFHLSGDDDARLLFNPDGVNADGAVAIASVAGWTEQYQWDRYDSQSSATFRLHAGRSYYIEAIGVHGLDLDHLEVGWSVPDGDIEVVPAEVLTPTRAGEGGWRRDATGLPLIPDKPKHLKVDSTTTTLHATWDAPTVSERHGEAVFYEVSISGDAELVLVTEETEVWIPDLPIGGRFWFEVVPWNQSGRGKEAAHTVHTDKQVDKGKNGQPAATSTTVPAAVPSVSDPDDGQRGNGKRNDKGELVDQLAPIGVFDATGDDVGLGAITGGAVAAAPARSPIRSQPIGLPVGVGAGVGATGWPGA
ncbi:PA14 domain-containing protein [Ilumatobacter fluminis]|nr:PA14 domain-containing protein [Ilumatobacter fluminis]